jgi:hypothetical protein
MATYFYALPLIFSFISVGHCTNEKWSWNQQNVIVKKTGDLQWQPQPFVHEIGKSLRYIDYENGKDTNQGTKSAPWKHHPWDKKARGKAAECSGIHTYIFKKGVTYRGTLSVKESGQLNDPIRLTIDPAWGSGNAVLSGSEIVRDWHKGATIDAIPDGNKVWYSDINFNPRNIWMVSNNEITRLPLARTPNWRISDPDDIKSEWFHWDNPGKHFGYRDGKFHKAFDTKNINQSKSYYENALIWTEWGWIMGTPFPTRVQNINLKEHSLSFRGQWGGPTGQIIRYNRYYLEDKPHYLDDPQGEFWFQREGKKGGRLFIRLPENQNPNQVIIEAAKRLNLIDAGNMNHIVISGLIFRFTNTFWKLTAGPWSSKDVDPACIRLLGSGQDIIIKNNTFEHINMAVRVKAIAVDDSIDRLVIQDNIIQHTDHGAFSLQDGGGWNKKDSKIGRLFDVKILRNNLQQIGMRPTRYGQGHAIEINAAETVEVSGNILDQCYGAGIFVYGAKQNELTADRPLSRILIHHNKITNSILNSNDWGGIETWQGGPAYVYNNISGNPGGYMHWKFKNHPKEPGGARFGHAYYLDGAFKNYYFNNIAWGRSKDPYSRLGNTSAFQEIYSYQNTIFNNTIYNFVVGSRRQAPQAGRDKYLANVWDAIGYRLFRHADPSKSMLDANAADAGKQKEHFAYETNAYAKNIFHDIAQYGVYESNGRWLNSFSDFKDALIKNKSMQTDLGDEVDETPLMDPGHHDFRLKGNSPAIDQGAKVFVPWSLYAMVGEWNFYPAGNDPSRIVDEHWYMAPYYTSRKDYHKQPMFPLKGVNISSENYVEGALEDWIKGALKLNGKNQYAVLPNSRFERPEPQKEKKFTFTKPSFDWVKIDTLDHMVPGRNAKINVTINDIPKGQYIHLDLHWHKKDNSWGGFNRSGGAQKVNGPGPYTFNIKPIDKSDLGFYEIIVYTSKNGSWKTHKKIARMKIAVQQDDTTEYVFKKPAFDWVKINAPDHVAPGKNAKINVTLNGIPKDQYIHVDLHWHKKDNSWGGFNRSGGRQRVDGPGPYTFNIKPFDKSDLGFYEIIVYASKLGSWKTKTKIAKMNVAVEPNKNGEIVNVGKLRSPQIDYSNFIVELFFKTEPNAHNAVLIEKIQQSGYSLRINDSGKLVFKVQGSKEGALLIAKNVINDGEWHHVIAECDRKKKELIFYIDGKKDSSGPGIDSMVNLANKGDLYVGGTPAGLNLAGTFDFLRISQGTLADAKTSIEELYDWQFNGPVLRDFCGYSPSGKRRDAGALENIEN